MIETQELNYETLERKYDIASAKWHTKLCAIQYPENYQGFIKEFVGDFDPAWDILDAGVGAGDFSQALIDVCGAPQQMTLLDISREMLAQARQILAVRIPEISTLRCSVEELNPDIKYDLILCAHVVEHCHDHMLALTALRSALKPGGRLLLVASKPHWCTALLQFVWGHKAFAPKHMETFLHQAGFAHISQHKFQCGPPKRLSAGYFATNPSK